jgi:hypothetical protein
MKKYRLAHDEIHLSYDKSVLFPDSIALVDDSPVNLGKALEAGSWEPAFSSPGMRIRVSLI